MHDPKPFFCSRRLAAAGLTLLCLCAYLLPVHSWGGDDANGDTTPAVLLPISILRYHAIDFTALLARHPELLEAGGQLPYYFKLSHGRVISFYPIVQGLLNLPIFIAASALHVDLYRYRLLLSYFTAVWESALSVGLMFLALDGLVPRRPAVGFALVYAFATAVFSAASHELWQHTSSMLLLGGALVILTRVELQLPGVDRWLPLAGALLALSAWNRPTAGLIALPLGIYVLHRRRWQSVGFCLTALAISSVFAAYSYLYCGSITALGQGREVISDLASAEGPYGNHVFFQLYAILFNPNRGLLVFDPIFLPGLALLGVSFFRRNIPLLFRYLAVGCGLTIYWYCRWEAWSGGWCFSYRLLIELIPPLTLAMAFAWQRWIKPRRLARAAFGAAIAYSLFVHFLGAFYYPGSGFNWDTEGGDVEARIWDIKTGELARDCALFATDVKDLLHGRFKPSPIPWPQRDPNIIAWSADNDATPAPSAPTPAALSPANQPIVLAGPQGDGALDHVDADTIGGFAFDLDHPDASVVVMLFDDGHPLASVLADQDWPSLKEAGFTNTHHGFQLKTPAALLDGKTHEITACVVGINKTLNDCPKTFP